MIIESIDDQILFINNMHVVKGVCSEVSKSETFTIQGQHHSVTTQEVQDQRAKADKWTERGKKKKEKK